MSQTPTMDVRFACYSCGQHLTIESDAIGEKLPCPTCNTVNAVPDPDAPGTVTGSDGLPLGAEPASSPPVHAASLKSRTVLWIAGSAGAAVVLGGIAVGLVSRSRRAADIERQGGREESTVRPSSREDTPQTAERGSRSASGSQPSEQTADEQPHSLRRSSSSGRTPVPDRLASAIEDLDHESLRRRLAAMTRLAREGHAGGPAVPAIVEALGREGAGSPFRRPRPGDSSIRTHGTWAVRVIDSWGQSAVPALSAGFKDERARNNMLQVASELGETAGPAVPEMLDACAPLRHHAGPIILRTLGPDLTLNASQAAAIAEHATSEDVYTRQVVACALGLADGASANALWPLLDDVHKDPRAAASSALDRLGWKADPAGAIRRDSAAIQTKAAALLGREGFSRASAIDALCVLLRDGTPEGQAAAAAELAVIGPPISEAAVPELTSLLSSSNYVAAGNAAWALGMIGKPLPAAAGRIRELQAGSPSLMSHPFMWALSRFGDISRSSLPYLLAVYRGEGLPLGPNAISVGYACQAIGGIGPPSAEKTLPVFLGPAPLGIGPMGSAKGWALGQMGRPAIDALRRLIANPEPTTTCVGGLNHVSIMGTSAVALIPDIVKLLRSVDPGKATQNDCFIARAAAQALGSMGAEAGQAVPALMAWLKADCVWHKMDAAAARMGTARALGRIGPSAAAAVPLMIKVLKSSDKGTRYCAAEALGLVSDGPEVVRALTEALHDERMDVRKAAAGSLGWIGEKALESVIRLLRTGDGERKGLALEALRRMGPAGREARRDVLPLLADLQSAVGQDAAAALAAMGPCGADLAAEAEEAARNANGDRARATGMGALAMLRRSEADVRWLLSRSDSQYRDAPAAIDRIAGLGLAAAETMDNIRERQAVFEPGRGAVVPHLSAARLLGRFDPEASRSRLRKTAAEASQSRFFDVRRAAAVAANAMQAEFARRNSPAMKQQIGKLCHLIDKARGNERRDAMRELGGLGPAALQVAGRVAKIYAGTRDAADRQAATRALNAILLVPPGHPDRAEALTWHLRCADTDISTWAADELRAIGVTAVPILCQAMRDDKGVRVLAARLLADLRAGDRASVTLLVDLADSHDVAHAIAGLNALDALGVANKPETLTGLIWKDAGGSRIIRGLALLDNRSIPVLASKLGDPDSDVREQAIVGLISYGSKSVAALIGALQSDVVNARRYAAEALGELRETAAPAAEALRSAARSEHDPHTNTAMLTALKAIGAVSRIDLPDDVARLFARMESAGPTSYSKRDLERVDKQHYPHLLTGLTHHVHWVRRGTAIMLQCAEPAPDGAEAVLRRALATEANPLVRKMLASAVGRVCREPVPELVAALSDGDQSVRVLAAQALAAMGPAVAPARDELLAALADTYSNVGQNAAEALAGIGPEMLSSLVQQLKSENKNVRAAALHGLGMLGAAAASALPQIEELARTDRNSTVRREAGRTAGEIRKAIQPEPDKQQTVTKKVNEGPRVSRPGPGRTRSRRGRQRAR